MVLLMGAHATTPGFMAAVGRLKFGPRIDSAKDKYLLRLIAGFVLLGYPVMFTLWLLVLVTQSYRGRVVTGNGFLVVLSERTTNPRPSAPSVLIGALVGVVLVVFMGSVLAVAVASAEFLGLVLLIVFAPGPILLSALLRRRRDTSSDVLGGVLLVKGFVPTTRRARGSSVNVAQRWLAAQSVPVGWVADEGLRDFYEAVLLPCGVRGVLINSGSSGFWRLLLPARHAFVKP